jgi:hypothetical protein
MNLTSLLELAGLMHVGLLWAGTTMLFKVKLREHLKPLPAFIRRLFWVYYCFIGLMLIGFGALTFLFASEMASGQPVARGLCVLLALFWTVRLVVAGFVFDVRPYLTHWFYRVGYQATNVVFIYLVAIYVWTAWRGGAS